MSHRKSVTTWWRHVMETIFAFLEFSSQMASDGGFDVFVGVGLSKLVAQTIDLLVQSRTIVSYNGPLATYVKWRVVHAPGMLGTFSTPPWVSDPDMHHDTCVTHVPRSLTSGFLWSRWRGKRSRHSRRIRNPQFYVSGKRPMCDSNLPDARYHWPLSHLRVYVTNHQNINTQCGIIMCTAFCHYAMSM